MFNCFILISGNWASVSIVIAIWCVQMIGYIQSLSRIRLLAHYTISLSSLCGLIWRHWTYRMAVMYILSSVCQIRLTLIYTFYAIHGLCILSLPMNARIFVRHLIININPSTHICQPPLLFITSTTTEWRRNSINPLLSYIIGIPRFLFNCSFIKQKYCGIDCPRITMDKVRTEAKEGNLHYYNQFRPSWRLLI